MLNIREDQCQILRCDTFYETGSLLNNTFWALQYSMTGLKELKVLSINLLRIS